MENPNRSNEGLNAMRLVPVLLILELLQKETGRKWTISEVTEKVNLITREYELFLEQLTGNANLREMAARINQ
jgi:hypothetical protein